jgi:hypothetical protein
MSAWSNLLILVTVYAAPGFARADVYSFTDANGVTHFSNVPADSRYQLLIATPTDAVAAAPKEKSLDWLARSAHYDGVITGAAKAATDPEQNVRAGAHYLSDLRSSTVPSARLKRYRSVT